LARLPLKYFSPVLLGKLPPGSFPVGRLPTGESYGAVWYKELPAGEEDLPLLIPEQSPRKGEGWYVFGAIPDGAPAPLPRDVCPRRPRDPFAAFGAIPGEPESLAKHYTLMAYGLEIAGGLFLLIGMALNILFITMILYLLQ
jgi:hypothetical protein